MPAHTHTHTHTRGSHHAESASVSPTRPRPAATGIMPAAGVPPSAGEEGRAVVPRSADAGGENGEKENLQRLAVDFVKHPHQVPLGLLCVSKL